MPFIAHRIFGWKPTRIDEDWGLSTIEKGYTYSLCNSMECTECDFVFLDMRFSNEEMSRLYDDYRGKEYSDLRENYEPGYSSRNEALETGCDYIAQIETFLQPILPETLSILDWGGDTGKNTPFRGKVSQVDIYDISNKPVIDGARRVSREQALENEYSLIVCSNVLEHVSDPSALLEDVKSFMTQKSVLYLEVPFEALMKGENANRVLSKKHWHEHINFFSKTALELVLARTNLSIISQEISNVVVAGKSCSIFQIAAKLRP